MKSWPTIVPLRHARFYAPKEGVFVTCCQLACKGGVFCCANDDTIFGTNTIPASWTLKLTEIWGESKNNFEGRSTPVCCPNYKTNSKGAFFWENPKTDLWTQIIRILHHQKNGRSEKGSFTMTTACPRALHGKQKKNKLILTAKTRGKSNMSYKWIYVIVSIRHCAVCGIKKVRYVKMGNTPMQTGSGKRKTKKKSKN